MALGESQHASKPSAWRNHNGTGPISAGTARWLRFCAKRQRDRFNGTTPGPVAYARRSGENRKRHLDPSPPCSNVSPCSPSWQDGRQQTRPLLPPFAPKLGCSLVQGGRRMTASIPSNLSLTALTAVIQKITEGRLPRSIRAPVSLFPSRRARRTHSLNKARRWYLARVLFLKGVRDRAKCSP